MNILRFEFEYEWEPFTLSGKHLTFAEHRMARLSKRTCSHWGEAVYKWEGLLKKGPHAGKVGILIGETSDLRQRIKQYIRGTQKHGNIYWRENFLENGDIRLYILKLKRAEFQVEESSPIALDVRDFSSGNRRVVYEQLLVLHESELNRPDVWLVNRKV